MKNLFSINFNYIKHINYLNNDQLCKITDLTNATISRLLNDKSTPNATTLLKINKEFGYSIDDLLKKDLRKIDANIETKDDFFVKDTPTNKYSTKSQLQEVEILDKRIEELNKTIEIYKQRLDISDQEKKQLINIIAGLTNNSQGKQVG